MKDRARYAKEARKFKTISLAGRRANQRQTRSIGGAEDGCVINWGVFLSHSRKLEELKFELGILYSTCTRRAESRSFLRSPQTCEDLFHPFTERHDQAPFIALHD